MVKRIQLFIFLSALCFAVGCQTKGVTTEVVKSFPINSMEGVLTQSGVMLDTVVSSDGKGSLKMNVTQPTVVKLFEVSGVDLENARLVYRAHVKTENVVGKAYLEMWCVFPGLGEYFSRSLQNPLQGTADWSILETPFLLQKGQKPELVKLNMVIDGQGTVWIDDITLLKAPLE